MKKEKIASKLLYIDLFAGCGGLSTGLLSTGWKGLFAVEKNKDAFSTLKHNLIENKKHFSWVRWLPKRQHNINTLLKNYSKNLRGLRGRVTLVAGGPPCQGFSTVGKRREEDGRNKLVDSYIKFIKLVQPKMLFFENVKGFTIGFKKNKSKGRAYSSYVLGRLVELGYDVHGEILDFSRFGIPQRRKRFILVGTKIGSAKSFFEKIVAGRAKFLKSKGLTKDTSLENAISDLLKGNGTEASPDKKGFLAGKYSIARSAYQRFLRGGLRRAGSIADSHRFANHTKPIEKKFSYIISNSKKNKEVDEGIGLRFNFKKKIVFLLDAKSQSPTLTTLPDDCVHYCEPRILTVREYARIQSFPDWFEFKGKYTTGNKQRKRDVPRYTQVGNAIPPLFGEQTGLILKEMAHNG